MLLLLLLFLQLFWCPPACSLHFRSEWRDDNFSMLGKLFHLGSSCREKIGVHDDTLKKKELQGIGVNAESEETKLEIFEKYFYPTSANDDIEGSQPNRCRRFRFSLM